MLLKNLSEFCTIERGASRPIYLPWKVGETCPIEDIGLISAPDQKFQTVVVFFERQGRAEFLSLKRVLFESSNSNELIEEYNNCPTDEARRHYITGKLIRCKRIDNREVVDSNNHRYIRHIPVFELV